jgi:tetratricopeptide (TPR) repeat protein
MSRESGLDAARRFVRQHERGLIRAWIVGAVLLVLVLFTWGIVFRGAERVVDAWQARWPARIDRCASLAEQGRFEEAAQTLEQLDQDFPARTVKHRYDRERERLLTLLAHCYVKLDRKKRALAACERLVAFDPRNFENHYTQARTALAFGEGGLAQTALDALLAIHPTHAPAVEARIKLAFDGGQFAKIPPLWRAYVDAFRPAPVDFSFAGASVHLEVPSDGTPQRFEFGFALDPQASGEALLLTHGWSLDVREIGFLAPQLVGVARTIPFTPVPQLVWRATGGEQLAAGQLRASDASSSLRGELRGPEDGAARGVFELVAYKACSETLWSMVATSYRNLLLWDELEGQAARMRIGGCAQAGTVFED